MYIACASCHIACTSCYIPRFTTLYFASGWSRLANPFRLGRTLAPGFACSSNMPFVSLRDGQAPQAGLAAPKRPQPRVDLVDIAAPSSVHCCRVCAAKGEAGILALGEHVRDRRSRVTSQKQRDKGDPAHHILDWSHVEAGCRGWFVQLHHPSVLHRPLEGQRELFKCTEENQGAFNVIRPFFVGFVFRQSPIRWTQNTCEVELWTGIPTVFQGNSVAILLNAVGKRRDHNNCILHTGIQLISICRRKSCDIP